MSMKIFLTNDAASENWGKDALLTSKADGFVVHLNGKSRLDAVQKAARKVAMQGISHVELAGEDWDLDACWHFWLGFKNPKGKQDIKWAASLTAQDKKELETRLLIIGWVRDVINKPAADLGPKELANEAIEILTKVTDQVSYSMISGEELNEKGYTGIYSVGKSSVRPPVLLSVDYNPSKDPNAPVFACFVGKGITFDTGGNCIKPPQSMNSMKADMGGSGFATGALAYAIAKGLNKRIKLFLCCADNMVSGSAFNLGDILTYRNGKTVEIMNTDAEGRIVLADGLIDADNQNPTLIVDFATLTGAAKTAVGNDYHAVLSMDDQLVASLLDSANEENERFWRLPFEEFHRGHLPSPFADLCNIASSAHTAGASSATAFLSYFVKNYEKNWLHIDCSATYRKAAVDKWAVGATGFGVLTLANFLLKQANK